MLPIHFPGLHGDAEVIPIARALGVGPRIVNSPDYLYHFEKLLNAAPTLWQSAPAENAALFIYPYFYEPGDATTQAAQQAQQRGVPILFFRSTDIAVPVHLPYGTIYRDSLFADELTPSEKALPAFCGNMLAPYNNQVPLRPKSATPSVGFCGYVGTALRRMAYRLSGRQEKYLGLALRHRALRALRRGGRVECRFIVRTQYWGGSTKNDGKRNLNQAHREYVDNIFNSDYTLCLRGAGNYSYRFYETLAAGRIPLFVNTKCVLPFADRIDYKKHGAWVEERDLKNLGTRVGEFHARLTDADFKAMQTANRRLWEEWLEPLAFYKRIMADALGQAS